MKNISLALAEFQSKVPEIKKEAENPFFHSKYASLGNILTVIKPILAECKLVITQIPVGENELLTKIIHTESGEIIEGTFKFPLAKNDPQGLGSAITYMRRYSLVAMLGLNTEDDDDGNAASIRPQKPKTAPKQSVTTPQVQTTTPTPKPAINANKDIKGEIFRLAKQLAAKVDPAVDLNKKVVLEGFIYGRTQLRLIEQNYQTIAERLEILIGELN